MNPVELFLQKQVPIETYERVEQKYKDNPTDENKYKAACSLIESGDCNAAVEDGLQYLYQLYDDDYNNVKKFPKLLSKFVYVFIKQEMYERAEQWLDEWLELQPGSKEALLAGHWLKQKTANPVSTKFTYVPMNPVELFLQTGIDEDTLNKVEQKYKDNPTDENKYKAACSLIESNECNAAVEDGLQYLYQLYDGDYDNVKKFPKLLSKFVYVFIKQEMYERAKQWLDEWLELQPNNEEALLVQEYVEKKMAEIETQDSRTCCVVL